MNFLLSLLLLLPLQSTTSFAKDTPAEKPAAHTDGSSGGGGGGCEAFKNLPKDAIKKWKESKPQVAAVDAASFKAITLHVDQRADLTLLDSGVFKLVAKVPDEKMPPAGQKSYGGLASFESGKGGDYAIAANEGVWIEVVDVDTNTPVKASAFEKQDGCDVIHKAVRFPLKAKHVYGLQFSGAKKALVSALITRIP